MWLKLRDNSYMNLDNGYVMGVGESRRDRGSFTVWVVPGAGQPQHVAEEGYRSRKEAVQALDEFMSDKEFVRVPAPTKDEEVNDTADEDDG